MLTHRTLIPSALLALSTVLLPAKPAEACSGPACWGGFLVPSGGDVPASLPGFRWTPMKSYDGPDLGPSDIQLLHLTPNGEVPVAIEAKQETLGPFVVTIKEPLEPNAEYVIRGANGCDGDPTAPSGPTEATLHTTEAVALPSTLGVITPTVFKKDIDVTTPSGSCTAPIKAAVADLSLTLSADAAPWDKALIITTYVDGQAWSNAKSMIYAQCQADDPSADKGVAEGDHTVTMQATLPGTDLVIETAPVTVTLSCADMIVDPPGPDPKSDTDADADAGSEAGGCAVSNTRAARGQSIGDYAWIAAVGGLAAWARRRRSGRRG